MKTLVFVGVREEITGWDHRGDRTLVCYLVAHEAAFAVPYYVDNHKMLKPSENPCILLVYVRRSQVGIIGGDRTLVCYLVAHEAAFAVP